jgi:hypothetical protein
MLAGVLLTGCAVRAQEGKPEIRELQVVSTEYRFSAPDTVEAGLIRIRLQNQGRELHHLQLLRLDQGLTAEEVVEHARRDEFKIPGLTYVGGPSIPPPGGSSEVTVQLRPGRYLMVCYMPTGKVPHLAMGMTHHLVVRPAGSTAAAPPVADAGIRLSSYQFELRPGIRPGSQVIRVENLSDEPHEVDIVRITEGRTFEDVLTWLEKKGPPPFEPAGGTMVLSRGEVSYVTMKFTPGAYALICFVPDSRDRRAHAAHGMVRGILVS